MLSPQKQSQFQGSYGTHSSNEFQRPFAVDLIPSEKVCDWCNQMAEREFTALGGRFHNRSGIFCNPCGEQFLQGILHSSQPH